MSELINENFGFKGLKHLNLPFLRLVAALLAWLCAWLVPWSTWFESSLWLRLAIALALFITPGVLLYILLHKAESNWLRLIPSGFVFSHFVIAFLGTLGRLFELPFSFLKISFIVLGIILLITHYISKKQEQRASINFRALVFHCLAYSPLILIATLTILMTIQRVISSDDLAYLAHLTNWQKMPNLNFQDVYFDTTAIESTRFWISSAPLNQAYLADISKIHGLLLLSGYYEPFLAVIALLCWYDLARTLGLSHSLSLASITVQVTFLALLSEYIHPGAPFFHQLSTDKATAAFIFTPVFVSNAIRLLNKWHLGLSILLILSGLSLNFMHPVISAFAVFIVVVVAGLGIQRNSYKKHLVVIVFALVSLSPQLSVRLVGHEAQSIVPNTPEVISQASGMGSLINQYEGTPFYGFNPSILEMHIPFGDRLPISHPILSRIWMILPVLAILTSIKSWRHNYLKQYILATSMLVALAGIPYTGWILGYFVSAWVLERTTWLYPFGISTIFLFDTLIERFRTGKLPGLRELHSRHHFQIGFSIVALVSLWVVSILLILLFMYERGLPKTDRLVSTTQRHQELVAVGQYFEHNASNPFNVVSSDELNDFIPTLSWNSKVISYRPEDNFYPYFFSTEEKAQRWSERQAILSPQIQTEARIALIQKYNVRFLLLKKSRSWVLEDLLSTYPDVFIPLAFGRYLLVEVK